jgi:hypothetical protein
MYQPTEADLKVSALLKRVEAFDEGLYGELSDAISDQLSEYEDRAVRQHGRQILAMIEGTTWASAGNVSMASEDESTLVRLLDKSTVAA